MAERIGLTKNITLEWMELAANCKISGLTLDEAYPILKEKIGETIKSPVNSKQIRGTLFNIWFRPEDWFLNRCTEIAKGMPAVEKIPVHWALLLKRYKVFYDLTTVIGGLFDYREEITANQIRNRIFEIWGARDTLQACLPKNIQTFKELKALNAVKPAGTYTRNIMTVSDVNVVQMLCIAVIEASGKEYMTWEEVVRHPALFPFHIVNVSQGDMAACERVSLEKMAGDVVIRVKKD